METSGVLSLPSPWLSPQCESAQERLQEADDFAHVPYIEPRVTIRDTHANGICIFGESTKEIFVSPVIPNGKYESAGFPHKPVPCRHAFVDGGRPDLDNPVSAKYLEVGIGCKIQEAICQLGSKERRLIRIGHPVMPDNRVFLFLHEGTR